MAKQIKATVARKTAIIDAFADGVPASVLDLLDRLEDMLYLWLDDAGALTVGELASVNASAELAELVSEAGLEDLLGGMRQTVRAVQEQITLQLRAGGYTRAATTLDTGALEALIEMRVRNVAEAIAGPAAKVVQQAWADATFTGVPLDKALQGAIDQLKDKLPSVARTEVGTATSSIDREITAGAGEAHPDTVYLYVGPSPQAGDRITRASCRCVVNMVATREQIARLDNGQVPNVLVSGGGWNCRHSWAPMLRKMAIAQGIRQVTEADIEAFNDAGRSGKAKKGKRK